MISIEVTTRSDLYELIGNIVNALAKTGDTLKASDLVGFLNQNNHKTTKGKPYSPNGRGIFKVLSDAYRYHEKKGDKATADNLAGSILNKKNKQAWDK